MAPDQTPAVDEWSSLTCVIPDCGEALAVRWELYAPLMGGELAPDADPLVPGDAVAGDWEVRCLNGHVILRPGDKLCPGDTDLCGDDVCDHDHDEDLRTWRRGDVERLAALQQSAGVLPAEPDPFDHVLIVRGGSWALDHPESCTDAAEGCPVSWATAETFGTPTGLTFADGRYQVGVNDLGDRLLIGDRIGGTDGD